MWDPPRSPKVAPAVDTSTDQGLEEAFDFLFPGVGGEDKVEGKEDDKDRDSSKRPDSVDSLRSPPLRLDSEESDSNSVGLNNNNNSLIPPSSNDRRRAESNTMAAEVADDVSEAEKSLHQV